MKKVLSLAAVSLIALACENNPTAVSYADVDQTLINGFATKVVKTKSDLENCTEANSGKVYYIQELSQLVFCDGSFYQDVKVNKNEAGQLSFINLGKLASHPQNPIKNSVYLNTTDSTGYMYDGSNWIIVKSPAGAGSFLCGPGRECSLDELTWFTSSDVNYKGQSQVKQLARDALSYQYLVKVQAGASTPFGIVGIKLDKVFKKLSMNTYSHIMVKALITQGISFRLEFIQPNITDYKYYGYDLKGQGQSSYSIPLKLLSSTTKTGLPFDPSLVTGIQFVIKDMQTGLQPSGVPNFVFNEVGFASTVQFTDAGLNSIFAPPPVSSSAASSSSVSSKTKAAAEAAAVKAEATAAAAVKAYDAAMAKIPPAQKVQDSLSELQVTAEKAYNDGMAQAKIALDNYNKLTEDSKTAATASATAANSVKTATSAKNAAEIALPKAVTAVNTAKTASLKADSLNTIALNAFEVAKQVYENALKSKSDAETASNSNPSDKTLLAGLSSASTALSKATTNKVNAETSAQKASTASKNALETLLKAETAKNAAEKNLEDAKTALDEAVKNAADAKLKAEIAVQEVANAKTVYTTATNNANLLKSALTKAVNAVNSAKATVDKLKVNADAAKATVDVTAEAAKAARAEANSFK